MKKQLITFLLIFSALASSGQRSNNAAEPELQFTPLVKLKTTPVKDQAGTSTCWSFGTTSFIETELLRMGKGEYDLSEMWIVRHNYTDRLRDNFAKKGDGNLGEGGLAHDWMLEFIENGIVPEEVYSGLNYGLPEHNHGELNALVKAIGGVSVKRNSESDEYLSVIDAVLDTYLGRKPETFIYKGVGYTPKSFARSLDIDPGDYVEITSFGFIPFYEQGIVHVPDNWRNVKFHNVPLDDLIAIMDNALNNGYSVNWDGDVSEMSFSNSKGYATLPQAGKSGVSQDMREKGYENKQTTDDHTMHITGISRDQNGNKYYLTKNSWGPDGNSHGGYLNMSENYVRAKTIFVMVHKDAVPKEIRGKLGI